MLSNVSYPIELKNCPIKIMRKTITIYQEAVDYLCEIVRLHWDDIKQITKANLQQRIIENLTHSSGEKSAKYSSFDKRFYKFPSYLRRNAIDTAVAIIKSHMELLELWYAGNCQGAKPKYKKHQNKLPCFFKSNTFIAISDKEFQIKLFDGHDWKWFAVNARKTDADYIKNFIINIHTLKDQAAPVLQKRHGKYILRFAFKVKGSDKKYVTDKFTERCVGVDLGLNTDAVCSCVTRSGTVIDRKFINSPIEKDRLYTCLNRISKNQKFNNSNNRLWRFTANYKRQIINHTASEIVRFAVDTFSDVIVFEHLGNFSKKRSYLRQKIHHWGKRNLQHKVEEMAARYGIRVVYVNAAYTSKLAFDGSGEVVRHKDNYELCTFSSGKEYNCDLNASYNIGARYFIRSIIKSLNKSLRLFLEAKVPSVSKRTKCTLNTLINLNQVTSSLLVAA